MHNPFVADLFPRGPGPSWKVKLGNRLLSALGQHVRLEPPFHDGMASVEFRINLYHLAAATLEFDVPGDFVEVGCNDGESSLLLQRLLRENGEGRKLHVFDSFAGVPAGGREDKGSFERGEMSVPKSRLIAHFETANVPLPEVHEGWFEDTLPGELPERVAFALIDADLYQSTLTALSHVYRRMSEHACGVLGVYCDPSVHEPRSPSPKYRSPGVKKACDEFFAGKPESVSVLYAGDYTIGQFWKRA